MNAEIFYFSEDQKMLALRLRDLLRVHVHPSLSPILTDVAEDRKDTPELGWRYIKLLQASIPPERGIKLSLREISLYGYSFYIQVYYPFVFQAQDFQFGERRSFFPAVAAHDRMVLVPQGLASLLEHGSQLLAPFNPLEMGGVEVADLDDEAALGKAFVHIGEMLRAELVKNLRAYASYHDLQEINLPKISQDFGVDVEFIARALQDMAAERSFYDSLTCELEQSEIKPNRWSRLTLTIKNKSEVRLSNAVVEVSGPAKILPTRIRANIPPASAQQISIALMPEEVGDFPLEIMFVLPEDKALVNWLPVHHVWLHCE